MQRLFVIAALVTTAIAVMVAPAFAAAPGTNGQPSQTCLSSTAPSEPGHAASAPGSAFNENGGTAGAVYANPEAQGGLASGNTHVVAQYDVACFQVSTH